MPACLRCGTDNPEHARFCLGCGSPLEDQTSAGGSRRTVTVMFTDVVGSTSLGERHDPELVRAVLTRYFAVMATAIERHGGTVEKYIGDAIMAVFGFPSAHEDDALRAARAAIEMHEALAKLNDELRTDVGLTIAARTGIATGEVVAGDPAARERLVTGDAVNTAARLEQAARPGEIVVGEPTWRLIRAAAIAVPMEPIAAKGKTVPLECHRLISVAGLTSGRADRRPSMPLVGRSTELDRLKASFATVAAMRRPWLVTVCGPAGVGKSRLVTEFVSGLGDRATALSGRCLPYGDGITWWPLREIMHAAAGIAEDDSAEEARSRLNDLVIGVRDGPIVAARIASAIGLSAEPAPREELFWAFRRTLEMLAKARPLVLVVEDIHWAEAALLDLLVHLVAVGDRTPLLLVCPARPEVSEIAPGWSSGQPSMSWLALEGLGDEATAALIGGVPGGAALSPVARERVIALAEGNPLFAEELARMLAETGSEVTSTTPLPPTVTALLASRIDGLPGGERETAKRGSVIGRVFEAAPLQDLTPDSRRAQLPADLAGLVRRDLLLTDERASDPLHPEVLYRFRHILIRDAAYDALTKVERAGLHERLADWLEAAAGDRLQEYEEILGHHLERAHHYRMELHDSSEGTRILGLRAAAHLRAASQRARARGDSTAALELLCRVDGLPMPDRRWQAEILLEAALACADIGRLADGRARAEESLAMAIDLGDHRLSARARVVRCELMLLDGTLSGADPSARSEREAALGEAQLSGDPRALVEAWQALSTQAANEGRLPEAMAAEAHAQRHAHEVGDARLELETEIGRMILALTGPSAAGEVVARAEPLLEQTSASPVLRSRLLAQLSIPEAMLGRTDVARAHIWEAIALARDLALPMTVAEFYHDLHWVERLAGDLSAAETALRWIIDDDNLQDRGLRAFATCRLGEVLVAAGRFEEAADTVADSERNPLPVLLPRVVATRARILAERGDPSAEAEVERSLAMVASSPYLNQRMDLLIEAAEATARLGNLDKAAGYARDALRLAETKENIALAGQIRALLARLEL